MDRCMFHAGRNIALQAGTLYAAANAGPLGAEAFKLAWKYSP